MLGTSNMVLRYHRNGTSKQTVETILAMQYRALCRPGKFLGAKLGKPVLRGPGFVHGGILVSKHVVAERAKRFVSLVNICYIYILPVDLSASQCFNYEALLFISVSTTNLICHMRIISPVWTSACTAAAYQVGASNATHCGGAAQWICYFIHRVKLWGFFFFPTGLVNANLLNCRLISLSHHAFQK